MPESSRRTTKGKIRWSKLYNFTCLRPSTADSVVHLEHLGQPGFSRLVLCNEPQLHKTKPHKYPSNYVSTTKYNVVTFLPKSLFEQFRRVANLYFLLAAVLSFTSLAPFSRISLVAPLVFVIGISMLKEAVEDWHRFLQDLNVNSRTVKARVGNGRFAEKTWRELSVGDVIKVHKNEYFPSDLLFLSSSYEDGICYVETMNLDGETNLKVKRCLEATLGMNEDEELSKFKGTVRCEDPNPNLYTFVGNLEFENESYALCPAQVLLRDSKLRNTDYIYGVVIFSGPDTKAVQNSTRSPSKRSRIEKKMDLVIYLLFSFLFLISLVTAISTAFYLKYEMVEWLYLRLQDDDDPFFNPIKPEVSGFRHFTRALILYGYLIPISLYVSIEVVKVLQTMLINKDIEMYDEVTCKSVRARTSNLNEELGQVEIILSDKTGTLTRNEMEFRKCSIAGTSYGGDIKEVDLAASRRMNTCAETYRCSIDESNTSQSFELSEFSEADIMVTEKAILGGREDGENQSTESPEISTVGKESVIKGFNFTDDRLMNNRWMYRSNLFDVIMFFRVMALCHTGIPVEANQTDKLKYEAESPEEVAFLVASQEFAFQFFRRTQSVMVLKELDPSSGKVVEREYKILHLLEFSSSRKRMSVIVRNKDGQIFLFCKGADSIIFDRLAENGKSYQEATALHLSNYAEDGFRTLAFAYRIIETAEYEHWNSIFSQAKTTIGPERDELLDKASELIEKDLILLGAAAVEDKLQKGVPECIDKLAQAGLKIWLLTGDKKETAVNIGFSCSLLQQDMKQFHICLSKEAETKSQVKAMKEDLLYQIENSYQVMCEECNKDSPFAMVVDGKALEVALTDGVKNQFLQLAVNCAFVICCRVSPKQKALITRLVKEYTGKTTLAIGDGANDVGMIQEADIGIGISGMEGMQAVMASDFSLPQFRFLERLLIVHGHWCYKRISKMILYFVYKNIVLGLTLFYYECYTSFCGEVLYDDWYLVLFNVILTSLPVISLGVLEQDVSSEICLQFPSLYKQGPKNIYFAWKRIIGWILNGVVASLIIFLANIYMLSSAAFRQQGEVSDVAHLGGITFTCIIWTVNCQIALVISHFTFIQHLFIWGSILSWYIFLLVYGALPPAYSKKGFHLFMEAIGSAPVYWMITLIVTVVSLLPYFMHIVIQRLFYPLDDHILQEMKYCKKESINNQAWQREQSNSRKSTLIGLSARVDARIQYLKEHLHQRTKSIYRSVTSSPLFQ
ncbi:hypothetical protein F2P56_007321 [Juglans regia]|uniref:Phospholipid-transporting ATPase n=2 Tax=Juglans regia TaxID=51240 RepID=A0A834D5Y7_JUGRE|nr:probable phospholipid-transporting ATPase 4 [Juglans regia]KAF5475521.1 hypothetical protein F2P56_007321 [Juglans regia]